MNTFAISYICLEKIRNLNKTELRILDFNIKVNIFLFFNNFSTELQCTIE